MFKRMLSAGLALCLLTGLLPASVMAEGEGVPGLSLAPAPAPIAEDGATGAETSGSCGENVSWSLGEDGVLTISGTGRMEDFGVKSAPWKEAAVSSAVISEGVTHIGNYAFDGCSALQSVAVPDSVSSIGYGAFRNCAALTRVTLPKNAGDISEAMFSGCSSLESMTIPDSASGISSNAFSGCTSLTSITIPNSVTTISNNAFSGCTALQEVAYSGTQEQWNAINFNSGNSSLTGAANIQYEGEPYNGTCGDGVSWVLENGTLTISGTGEMNDYVNTYSAPTSIINPAPWDKCRDQITALVIGEGVTGRGGSGVDECKNLTSVTFPNEGITVIEGWTFYNCSSLSSITLPQTVKTIGMYAFEGTALTDVYYAGTKAQWEAIDINNTGNDLLKNATIHYESGSAENTCGDGLTWVLQGDGTLVISYTGTGTGKMADYADRTAPWDANRKEITAIVVEDGVTSIGSCAFYDCDSFTGITIPVSVTSIGEIAFYRCTAFSDVYYAGTKEDWGKITIGRDNNLTGTIHCSDGDICICGDGLIWNLSKNESGSGKTLVISYTGSGTGKMEDYSIGTAPWYESLKEITAVVVEDGITSIGSYAFLDGTALASVTLPDSITSIESYAFGSCSSLASITLPNNIASIGDSAFSHCDSLKNFTIPDNVTSIDSSTFYACTTLESITLPAGIRSIGRGAFSECIALTDVTFAGTKVQWGAIIINGTDNDPLTNATIHCSDGIVGALASGSCGDGLTWALKGDGMLVISYTGTGTGEMDTFSATGTGTAPWKTYAAQITSVRVGEGTTSIGSCAFYECKELKSASLPDSIKSIGDNAFNYCTALTELTIPEGVTRIGTRMLYMCSSLQSVGIPEGVEEIGAYAFSSCTKLESVVLPKSLKRIKNHAFYNCSSLADADIPQGVTEIGENAFASCTVLKSVSIPAGVTDISGHAFSNCGQLADVTLSQGVTTVGEYAFFGCAITDITLPEGVTSIGNSAFGSCKALKSVTIPKSVTSIGNSAFAASVVDGSTALTDVTYTGTRAQWNEIEIGTNNEPLTEAALLCAGELASGSCGDSLTWILGEDGTLVISGTGEMEIFPDEYHTPWKDYRENIKTVIIEEGATSIGANAFCSCENMTGVTLPESLTKMGTSAFERCYGLTEIVIPQGVVSIGGAAFWSCEALANVSLPESLTSMGEGAFAACVSLKSITIPAGLTSIAPRAFASCSSLAEITIPQSVTSIGSSAFAESSDGGTALTDVIYSGTRAQWSAIAIDMDNEPLQQAVIHCSDGLTGGLASGSCGDNLNWILKKDGTLQISGTGPMTDYNGDDVIFAPWYGYRAQITALVIEEGAASIGNYAFMQCAGLTEIALPESIARIGDYAFTECRGLARAALPQSLKEIGQYAFSDCSALTDMTLPAGITRIEPGVFSNCTGLASVNIPEKVTDIGADAFSFCSSLTEMNLPEGVTAIGEGAFASCGSLKKLTVPEGVTAIAEGTFRYSGLTGITLPKSMQSIERSAFLECGALADVYYAGTKAQWEAVSIGADNAPLESAAIHYLGGLANGQCGDSLSWLLSEDGKTLTISGSGDMWDYSASSRGGWEIGEATIENLALPQGLTRIGEYAFYHCSALTAAELPQSVSSIGDFAFSECAALQEMSIPGGTEEIGISAFAGCESLAGLRLSQGVKRIGTTAFARCRSLQELSLPEGVTEIGLSAFYGCSALQTLHAPKSLNSLGENAFSDCGALQDIYYSGSAQMWQALISPGNDFLQGIAVHYGLLQLFYEANGGSGSMAEETKTVTPGSSAVFTAAQNGFTAPEGSEFEGWNTAADGSGTAYSAGDSLTLSADITLYARWKQAQPQPEAARLDIDGGLEILSGKTLRILTGIDVHVYSGRQFTVSGSLLVAGKLQNEGRLEVSGQLQAQQGIENSDTLILSSGEITSSSAEGTICGQSGQILLSGGTLTNTGEGPALSFGGTASAAWSNNCVIRSKSPHPVLQGGVPFLPDGYQVIQEADGYYYLRKSS